MGGPWEKYAQAQGDDSAATGPWMKYQAKPQSDSSGFDPAAAVQGFGNMAAAGYVPELTGAVGKMIPDPNAGTDAQLKAQGFKIQQPEFSGATTDDSRAMQAQMAKDSPYSYYGGGVAGAVASAPAYGAALKGLGIAKDVAPLAKDAGFMAKAGNLGARMVQAGKEGAALGFASNPNTNVGDDGASIGKRVLNAGMGGAFSATIPVATDAVKGAWSAGKSAANWGGAKLLSSFGGVKPAVIKEYAQFADRINAAPSVDALKEVSDDFVGKLAADVDAKKITQDQAQEAYKGLQSDLKDAYKTAGYDARDAVTSAQQTLKDAHNSRIQQLSGDVYDSVKQLKSDVQKGSQAALDTLDKSESIVDLKPTFDRVDSEIAKAKSAGTDESSALAGKLQAWKDRQVGQYGDSAFGIDAKKLIQGLDQITTYSPNAGAFDETKNAAFKGVRSALDKTLKSTDSAYRSAMEPVAKDADLLDRVSGFGDKQKAAGLLQRINAPNQMENRSALHELGQKYGSDFIAGSQAENLPEQQGLNKALAIQESLRPDRVAEKLDQTLASSRQKSALDAAQSGLESAKQKLAPFKSLAPNSAGQTQVQQKLAQLGEGGNIELEGMFKELGKLTDTDFIQAMKDRRVLAAFEKGATNGSRNTAFGAIVGSLFGGVGVGTAAGAGTGRVVDDWGPAITKKILDGAIKISRSPSVATVSKLDLPESIKRNMVISLESYLAKDPQAAVRVASGNPKGEDRWAQQGIQKLNIQDQELASRILQDPKAKQLLIQASDLSPGSPAMKKIMDQIQKGWGQTNESSTSTQTEVFRRQRSPTGGR